MIAGGGELSHVAAAESAAWLTVNVLADSISLSVDAAGLAPGIHDAIVLVYRTAGSNIGGSQCIRVRLHLLPADDEFPLLYLYLPLAMRDYTPPEWELAVHAQ